MGWGFVAWCGVGWGGVGWGRVGLDFVPRFRYVAKFGLKEMIWAEMS